MRKGKLQQSVLVRSVFKMLGQKREDAAGPAVGRGVSALAGEKETQVFSCAPVLVKDPEDAVLAVCRVCNSVAAAGASAKGVLVSLMLPEAMEEKDLKELMRAVDDACVRYGTAVIGGHTEVTDGVLYPVLTVTAAGGTTRAGLFDPSCVTADLDLVVTKGIALGAVSYLAKTRRDELLRDLSMGRRIFRRITLSAVRRRLRSSTVWLRCRISRRAGFSGRSGRWRTARVSGLMWR